MTQTPSGPLAQKKPFTALSELPRVLALDYQAGNITCTMTWAQGSTVSFSELDVNITAGPVVLRQCYNYQKSPCLPATSGRATV